MQNTQTGPVRSQQRRVYSSTVLAAMGALLLFAPLAHANADDLQLLQLQVSAVRVLLDGGTTIIEGKVGQDRVAVRYDGRPRSPKSGRFFLERAGSNEKMEIPTSSLQDLYRALSLSVAAHDRLKYVGLGIKTRLIEAGLEEVHPDHFLRSTRITNVDSTGLPRGSFVVSAVTRGGSREFLVHGGSVKLMPTRLDFAATRPRELIAPERSNLLVALSKPAIDRLPNARLRRRARTMRRLVDKEHHAAKDRSRGRR